MKIKSKYILIIIVLITFCLNVVAQTNGGLLQTSNSPFVKLRNVNIGDVKWMPGFWGDRVKDCYQHMIPYMRKIYMERALTNFKIAAQMQEGEFEGSWWHDGDFYKWVEALVIDYSATKSPVVKSEIDNIISIIAKAQAADGYINTAIQIGHGKVTGGFTNAVPFKNKKRWESEKEHEMYNFGHLFTLAAIHYRATGEKSLLNIADKAATYLITFFKSPTPELASLIFNPPQIMGLVELYRSTGDKKYLDMANAFLNMKGTQKEKHMQTQDNVPVRQATTAVGHAVTGLYLFSGMADVYAETGDTSLLNVLNKLWEDITFKKMYITGGVGSYHNNSIKGNEPLHEAFGKDYDLPNSTAYNETCANISNAMFNWRMLGITGDEKYADEMEQVLYNSMLSSISLDGESYFYTNPLRWYGKDHQLLSQDAYQRWNLPRGGICCPPNTIRTIAEVGNYVYSVSDKSIWVNLYGSNIVITKLPDGTPVKWEQQTEYPWKENIKIICKESSSASYALMLRIPSWAEGASVFVNSRLQSIKPSAGSYYKLERKWKLNDVVELKLPMKVRMVAADEKVEPDVNHVAVERGPLVYCIESADAPDIDLDNIRIPISTQFTVEYKKDLLGGVAVLKGNAYVVPNNNHNNKLEPYKEIKTTPLKPLSIQLIPYYAWNNRGIGEMEVWIPEVIK